MPPLDPIVVANARNLQTIAKQAKLDTLKERVWTRGQYYRSSSAVIPVGTSAVDPYVFAPNTQRECLVGIVWRPGRDRGVGEVIFDIRDQGGTILGEESVPGRTRWYAVLPPNGRIGFTLVNPVGAPIPTNYVIATHFIEMED